MSIPAAEPTIASPNPEHVEVTPYAENIIAAYLRTLHKCKDGGYFADDSSIALPFLIKSIREALASAKSTGLSLRVAQKLQRAISLRAKRFCTPPFNRSLDLRFWRIQHRSNQ